MNLKTCNWFFPHENKCLSSKNYSENNKNSPQFPHKPQLLESIAACAEPSIDRVNNFLLIGTSMRSNHNGHWMGVNVPLIHSTKITLEALIHGRVVDWIMTQRRAICRSSWELLPHFNSFELTSNVHWCDKTKCTNTLLVYKCAQDPAT